MVSFVPIYGQDCVSLLGSAGISRTKLFAKDKIVQIFHPVLRMPVGLMDNQATATFSKTKNILMLGAGIQFAVDERTYLRAKIEWEGMSSFKGIPSKEGNGTVLLQPKNSVTYSIGVAFNFL